MIHVTMKVAVISDCVPLLKQSLMKRNNKNKTTNVMFVNHNEIRFMFTMCLSML